MENTFYATWRRYNRCTLTLKMKKPRSKNCRKESHPFIIMLPYICQKYMVMKQWNQTTSLVCPRITTREMFFTTNDRTHSQSIKKMIENMYCMVTEVNTASGCVFEELENHCILNNTLVVFMVDNGLYYGEYGLAEKWFPHMNSTFVPFIILDLQSRILGQLVFNDPYEENNLIKIVSQRYKWREATIVL